MTTHRIRIAVLMTTDRAWDCRGWGYEDGKNEDDRVLRSEVEAGAHGEDLERGARIYWIEADVPVPDAPGAIKGTVTEADHV